jgi:hypothetical protein
MTTEAVERALAELATRADRHPVPDRVRAVHRRARRNAAVRVAATTLAVAAVAVGTLAGTGGLPFARGEQPTRPPTPQPAPSGPHLDVRLDPAPEIADALPQRQPGIPVVVDVTVRGRLPVASDWSADQSILGLRIDWGDGGYSAQGVYSETDPRPTSSCPSADRLAELHASEPMTHHYPEPGTYTITYRTTACAPVGEVTKSIVMTVRDR